MTDLQKLTDLFSEFGIEYSKEWVDGVLRVDIRVDDDRDERRMSKVQGYGGFECTYMFDGDGKFIQVNIWE